MPFVPAICDSCYTMFSSGLYIRHVGVKLPRYEVESCPKCMQKGHIKSSIYNFVTFSMKVMEKKAQFNEERTKLYRILEEAWENEKTQHELKVQIKKEAPSYIDLLLLLPGTKEDYTLCLALMIQVLYAMIMLSENEDYHHMENDYHAERITSQSNLLVKQVIEQIYTNNTGVVRRLF